ncbi:MAG TPA: hypothetical protein VGI43_17580, partial [Mucilaginibacter sp.]
MENITIMKELNGAGSPHLMVKPVLRCYICSTAYHYKVKRSWFVRNVLFFLPIKVYFCGRCVKH